MISQNLILNIGLTALCLFILTLSGCVKQEASKVENSDKITVETSADPEIAKAQMLIEEMPDSPVGYNRLATIYIKKARETGDFSLNAKAESAIDEALKIKPDDAVARKLKASLQLTFHRFDVAYELGKQLEKDFPKDAFILGVLTDANNRVPNVETAILLGDIYTKTGDMEKAKQQYDLVEVIEQKMGINNDQKRLAMLWADRNIKLDEALAIATREHEMRKDIFTADTLAWVLYKKGNFAEAKKASNEAMRLKTNAARILYHAGMIEKELGNKTEAVRLLKKTLATNPKFDILQAEIAQKTLQDLS